mgnify:FL=1
MGDILKAKCSCGYVSSDLYIGVGRYSWSSHNLIFYCDDCALVQTVNNDSEQFVCLNCMNAIIPYPKVDDEIEYPEAKTLKKYHCPKCKDESLYFKEIGIWD